MKIYEYPNSMQKSEPVGDGFVSVRWPIDGETAHFPDGTVAPREWLFCDASGPEGSPYYIIECTIGDDLVPRVSTVMVCADRGSREVLATDLRRLRPLEEILEQSFEMVAGRLAVVVDEPVPVDPRDLAAWDSSRSRIVRGARREARRRWTAEKAREVAEVYVSNVDSGTPTKAVREHFGIKESTASLYVKRARPLIDKLIKERGHGR